MASKRFLLEQLNEELHLALSPIVSNRTKNPLLHVCSHFRAKAGYTNSTVSEAYAMLRLCTTEGQYHETNIMAAYKKLAGVTGYVAPDQLLQLLSSLTDGLPAPLTTRLLQVFNVLAHLPPDFATFHTAVKTCMLLEELVLDSRQEPSGESPQLAELHSLLMQLYQHKQGLSSLEPMEPFRRLRAVHLPQLPDSEEVLLDVTLQAEELSQQVQEIIGMLALRQ